MNSTNLLNIINSEKALKEISLDQLKKLSDDFPYFQSAKSLYLKRLFQLEDYHFNSFLKITAAYSGDRSVLFDYITSTNEEVEIDKNDQYSIDEISTANIHIQEDESIENENVYVENEGMEVEKEDVKVKNEEGEIQNDDVHKIINFKADDKYSFIEWLKLSNQNQSEDNNSKIIDKNTEEDSLNQNIIENKKDMLVEKFISSNPSLKPKKNDTPKGNIAKQSTEENEGWMTETLAQVYVEQKKYSKAIKAYKILGLKYPEKSGFFADRIRSIERLM
jgi:hypothetical protein